MNIISDEELRELKEGMSSSQRKCDISFYKM